MKREEVLHVGLSPTELHRQPDAPDEDAGKDQITPDPLQAGNAVFLECRRCHRGSIRADFPSEAVPVWFHSVNYVVPLLAAFAASGFALDLGNDWRHRPRPHAGMWALAMGAYALATWSLVVGVEFGWGEMTFRLFYWLGAIVNIPVLAAGSVFLVLGPKIGRRFAYGVAVWSILGGAATWLAPMTHAIGSEGIPEGRELFDFIIEVGGISLPGPRVFAAFAGGVATLIIVGLAGYSALKFRRSNRMLAAGNGLIVLGTLAPAFGGSFTALGDAAGFAIALLIGAILLWAGYRVATGSRRPSEPLFEPTAD